MQPGPGPYPYQQPPPPPKKGLSGCVIAAIVVGALVVIAIPVIAALFIYSTRRYLAAAKTAEAKSTIGAIARGARQSYEREQIGSELLNVPAGGHALCKSAVPVPSVIPKGMKYQPGTGTDFDTGSAVEGWKCLKFSMTTPIYYQYRYQQGSGYLSSPPPSARGFEASAQGDLDGDGDISTFALTGDVVGDEVKLSPNLYINNEFE